MNKLTVEGQWELRQYVFDEQKTQVRFVTDDVAIGANDSSVWVRRDGQWLCALHTESLAGDPTDGIGAPSSQVGLRRQPFLAS